MVKVSGNLSIPEAEIDISAIRAQGPGGQHVNKAATAIHLRFDIRRSSLPETCKQRLLAYPDQRISDDGVIIIKAQRHRSQEKNRSEAVRRLVELVAAATHVPKRRLHTRPSKAARQRRVDGKTRRGQTKALRKKISFSQL